MRKTRELRRRFLTGTFAMILALGIFGGGFFLGGMVSHAETQVKITSPKGANVRKEASTSSETVGGAEKGKVLTVLNQVQGADGYTWYQVQLNGNVTGYVRADLVEVTEENENTPETGSEGGGTTAPSEVMAVNPVSATVTGESGTGKIRDTASSEGQILAEVPADTVLTVTGQITADDGWVWYQASFFSGEVQVDGFIRSDYVTLSEELTPYTEDPAAPEEPVDPEPDQGNNDDPYSVLFQDGDWLLVDRSTNDGYSIEQLFSSAQGNAEAFESCEKTIKNQKIIIIILVFLLVAAAAGIAFLVFKIRDMMDSAYYNEVENETLRKRNAASGRGDQRLMHTVGTDKQPARPAGARPTAGTGPRSTAGTQGQRTAGSAQGHRSAATSQSQKSAGTSQGQRNTGSSQGQRSTGSTQSQRPVGSSQGQRPAGSAQGQKPAGASQGQRTRGPVQGQRSTAGAQSQRPAGNTRSQQSSQRVQPKNFLEEDDEFEFEFLNYDGDEE